MLINQVGKSPEEAAETVLRIEAQLFELAEDLGYVPPLKVNDETVLLGPKTSDFLRAIIINYTSDGNNESSSE